MDLLDWAEVEAIKQNAIGLHEKTDPGKAFLAKARIIAREICQRQGYVTADDVRRRIEPPKDVDSRIMGAIFSGKAWAYCGSEISRRGINHGKRIARFEYTGGENVAQG